MKNFSTTYIAQIVTVLAVILPLFGIEASTEALTTTLQTVIVVASGVWTLVERYKKGDLKWFGSRK